MLLHFTDLYAFYLNQDIYQITSVVMKWKCFLDDKIISEDTELYLVMSLTVNKVITNAKARNNRFSDTFRRYEEFNFFSVLTEPK